MKKLFFASIIMLVSIQSCNNSEAQINPEEQQHQTFKSYKTTAREAGELPPLTPEEEKAAIDETIETLRNEREAELKGETTERKNLILCHTSYGASEGHACVYTTHGYLVTVTWTTEFDTFETPGGAIGVYPEGHIVYHGAVTPRCNC